MADRSLGNGAHPPKIAASGIWKTYGNVVANRDVSIEVAGGVHAVLGENGAGKSTLMRMFYGVERPDRGAILLDDEPVVIRTPREAIARGIGMVFQHFGLVPGLTAAQNIVLGVEPTKLLSVDRDAVADRASALMERFDLSVELHTKVAGMSAARQQRVEILKALYRGARVLILDEPTALLTPQERTSLFEAIRHMTTQGTTVIFISHKLSEIEQIADTVTVMRAGQVVGGGRRANYTRDELVRLMVGTASISSRRAESQAGPVALVAEDLVVPGNSGQQAVKGVSLAVCAGEVLGLAGVEGNGQLEFLEALAGLRSPLAGSVSIAEQPMRGFTNREARSLGVAYVPEDRLATGIAGTAPIVENLLANRVGEGRFGRRGMLRVRDMRAEAELLVDRYDIRCDSIDQPAGSLSGGNIQKVVLAREISTDPKVLLVAEPTRGLDVGAIALVHEHLARAAESGTAVIVLSSDLDELLSVATRIAVFRNGEIVGIRSDVPGTTAQQLGRAMLGATAEAVAA